MAHTKLTAHKRVIMPTKRTRFTVGKRIPPHLVKALRDMEEEPQEKQPMDVPMDEDVEEELVFKRPAEEEDTEEDPMEQDEHEGAGDPDDGDGSDSSDTDSDGMTMAMVVIVMMTTMATMLHYWLRDGQWRSILTCMVMPTTIRSFSLL